MSIGAVSENNPTHHKLRERSWLAESHAQSIQGLVLEPIDLLLLERWMQNHIRENAQRRLRLVRHHDYRRARRVPMGARIDRAPERFDRARNLRRGHALGPPG